MGILDVDFEDTFVEAAGLLFVVVDNKIEKAHDQEEQGPGGDRNPLFFSKGGALLEAQRQ